MNHDDPARAARLDAALAALPAEEAPSRDLWPGILEAISAEPRRVVRPRTRWPYALAAGVVLATVAGYAGWMGGRLGPPSIASAPAGSAAESMRQASFAVPAGGEYLATRVELERVYRERLELIAPATRLRIEADLRTIRKANDDIRQALAADPQSPVLNRLLQSIWQQEFDLYTTVARSSDPAAQRTRT